MNFNKITGYLLLIIGLAMITLSVFWSYSIFMAKSSAPLVFKTHAMVQAQVGNAQDVQTQINEAVKNQISDMISAGDVTKILNLLSWTLLASLLIVAGGIVSGIGVKLSNGGK